MHRISMGLRPSVLDDLGLLPTVSWFCREAGEANQDIRIEWHLDAREEDIPEPLKLVVFRILQEAVNNALKHSGGESLQVSLAKVGAGSLQLTVQDDGRGVEAASAQRDGSFNKGLGLGYMKERALQSGGTFRVESNATGTTVVAAWPAERLQPQGVTSPRSMA